MNVFFRYLTGGGVILTFNLTMAAIADQFEIVHASEIHSNVAHFVVTEMALLFAFFVHNSFTWPGTGNVFVKIWRFHVVSLFSLLVRFTLFFILSYFGVTFLIATLAGITGSILLNFVGYHRVVFSNTDDKDQDPYSPDGDRIKALETLEEAVNYNSWIASKIIPYLGSKNIELGAGTGTISQYTIKHSQIMLCELADENIKTLKKRFKDKQNITKITKDIFSIKQFNSYDCIYSSNVMEHIADDLGMLDHCLSLLKPGGNFVAFVPAGYFMYSKMDKILGHFRRYDWNDFFRIKKRLKTNHKAKLAKFRFFNPVGAMGWLLKMKILGALEITPSDAKFMNTLMPYLSKLDIIPIPFGQNLLIVITKEAGK